MEDVNPQLAILKRLLDVWEKYPELRLGQLIGNVYHYPSGLDPYFDNDQTFIAKIEAFYGNLEAKNGKPTN